MRVEPKALVRKMNTQSTQALEAAVDRAAQSRHYEITVEHLLLALLEQGKNDVEELFASQGVDRRAAMVEVQRAINKLNNGNTARPVFSETLFNWIENAWLVGSVNHGFAQVRTGELLFEYLSKPERYSAIDFDSLQNLKIDGIRKVYPAEIRAEAMTATQDAVDGSPGVAGPGGSAAAPGREALDRFCVSFTDRAQEGKIDKIFGRDTEIRQVVDILSRRRKNNPMIVGEPGVGKTALVEGLALAIVNDEVPESMRGSELLGLDLGLLQAGAGVKGELESRLKRVIAEVKASPTPIILFIDEAHTILGTGGADKGELANLLKPELARGELRTVAATTWAEYKKYFEKDAALERRFQPVKVEEPSVEQAIVMLRGLRSTYETAHKTTIRDEAVQAAAELSSRYISGRQLPDKAVDLLDTAAARVKIEKIAPPLRLVHARSDLASLERAKVAMERDRHEGAEISEDDYQQVLADISEVQQKVQSIESRWSEEKAALESLISAQQGVQDAGDDESTREGAMQTLKGARTALQAIQGEDALLHAEVDRDAVARVVADWTGIPVGKMQSSTIGNLLDIENKMKERIRGQDTAMQIVGESVRMAYAGVRDPKTPIAVLLFVGPSGVGKTETVLTLADTLYGGESAVTSINMSEFQEKHTVSRLVGSPPGYVGYGEGGVLTEAVRQKPYSVVLLDECEKADLEVMNLFYQVFDKGTLSDGEGREIDFRNTVVVLTSNLASELITRLHANDAEPTHEQIVEAIRPVLSKHFKPALLGRMTIVPYRPLRGDMLKQISKLKLNSVAKRLTAAHDVEVEFAEEVYDSMAQRCSESEAGARAIDQMLRASLMPALAREVLTQIAGDGLNKKICIGLADKGWDIRFE